MNFLETIKGQLIVSVQAQEGEPLFGDSHMKVMSRAVKEGGAKAIRACSVVDINAIALETNLPIIGLIKKEYKGFLTYITPTIKEIDELLTTSCQVIAIDATKRVHPGDLSLKEKVDYIHSKGRLVMADISDYEEGVLADSLGFDLLSTTLSGYTDYSPQSVLPDYKLVKRLVKTVKIPVIAEGKIWDLKQLSKILKLKPYAVVIGSAITRPKLITKRFIDFNNKIRNINE
jgi:N-acylglucosamine-6-phosphate 2-epimerase